jgi:hypothetical protein
MQANPSQRAVLALVLDEHPDQLTTADLEREVGTSEQAIQDLAVVGLLRRQGDSILPTRAALHFERLEAL